MRCHPGILPTMGAKQKNGSNGSGLSMRHQSGDVQGKLNEGAPFSSTCQLEVAADCFQIFQFYEGSWKLTFFQKMKSHNC